MKFSVNKKVLETELSFQQKLFAAPSTQNCIKNISLLCIDDTLFIKSSGKELTIISALNVGSELEIIQSGEVGVNGLKFLEAIKSFNNPSLTISDDNKGSVILQHGRARVKLQGQVIEHIRTDDTVYNGYIEFKAQDLKAMIERASKSVSIDPNHSILLNGVYFDSSQDSIRMTSTDGHRVSILEKYRDFSETSRSNFVTILSKKIIDLLLKLLTEKSENKVNNILFSVLEHRISIQCGNRTIYGNTIPGKYPDLSAAIPKSYTLSLYVDSEGFKTAVKRAMLVVDDKVPVVSLHFTENRMEIVAASREIGEVYEIIEIEYQGEQFSIKLNAQYLLEFLLFSDTNTIILSWATEGKDSIQTTFQYKDSQEYIYKYLIMQLR